MLGGGYWFERQYEFLSSALSAPGTVLRNEESDSGDSVTYHAPAARLVLDTVGADHVLYGSDAPPLTSLKPRAIKLIQDLDIPAADKEKIFWSNARRLLKLN